MARSIVLLVGLWVACSDRPQGASPPPTTERADPAVLGTFATELAAITGAPPSPTPALPAGVAVTAGNTLVITSEDLGLLRGEATAATTDRAPARALLTELLVEARGGKVPDRSPGTAASRATALASVAKLAYVAVVAEHAWLNAMSRQTVAIWDRAAKRWAGTLWVTLPLTAQPDKEMAMFSSTGKQVGTSFTVAEKPDERVARHRREVRGVIDKALADRASQWVGLSAFELPGPAFDPATDPRYVVPKAPASPARGGAEAGVVIELFAQHGDAAVALLVARIGQVYGDRVRVVWRDHPLGFLAYTEPAAHAAREVFAASGADAFWRYLEALAARKDSELTSDGLVREAEQLGVDGARVRAAIETRAHRAAINADLAAFRAAKLPTKPSIATFTNGWVLSTTSFAAHTKRIDAALH